MCLTSFTVALIFTLRSGNYWLEIFNSYVGSMPLLIIAFFEIISVAYIYGINRSRLHLIILSSYLQCYSTYDWLNKVLYCTRRFNDDIEKMTGHRPNLYWQATWRFISPLMLLVVFIAYVVVEAEKRPTYNAWNPDYVRPICLAPQHHSWTFVVFITKCQKIQQHWFSTSLPPQVNFPLADVQHYPEWVYTICVLLSVFPVLSIPLVALYRFSGFLKNYIMNRNNQNPYAN